MVAVCVFICCCWFLLSDWLVFSLGIDDPTKFKSDPMQHIKYLQPGKQMFHLLLLLLAYLLFSFFRLGVNDIIECATDPQQHLEHNQQQGKLFDHIIPISIKLTFIYNCMYAWLFVYKLWIVDPIDAWLLDMLNMLLRNCSTLNDIVDT